MTLKSDTSVTINTTLQLPCGARLKNRLSKSPMSDSLGDGMGNPTEAQMTLYKTWAKGGVALSAIGEVQIDPHFPEKPGNLVLGPNSNHKQLLLLTQGAVIDGAHLWPQLGHAGALAHLPISRPKGPSPIDVEGLSCEGMTTSEVQLLPSMYAKAAKLAKETNFTGVLIHAGHGFLLSQFLSPLFNHRKDQYGGSMAQRSQLILEIIEEVRIAIGPAFPIGIRINSSDNLAGGLTQEDALVLVRLLDKTSVDLIDISGGTYFPGAVASSESSSQGPYFIDFAQQARELTHIPLMLTGGFKSLEQANHVIASGIVDMVGLGRSMILEPNLPNLWLSGKHYKPIFPRFNQRIQGGLTAWYSMKQIAIGEKNTHNFDMDLQSAIEAYEARDHDRCAQWNQTFY